MAAMSSWVLRRASAVLVVGSSIGAGSIAALHSGSVILGLLLMAATLAATALVYSGRRAIITGAVLGLTLLAEYGARPIYELGSNQSGWNVLTFAPFDPNSDTVMSAAAMGAIGVIAAGATASLILRRTQKVTHEPYWLTGHRGGAIGPVVAIVAGFVLTGLSITSLGFQAGDLDRLVDRSISGQGAIYALAYGASAGIMVALVLAEQRFLVSRAGFTLFGIALLAAIAIYGLVLGGRSEVITLILGATAIVAVRVRPPRVRTLILAALTLAVLASLYRAAVREPYYNSALSSDPAVALIQALQDPFRAVLSGPDISAFDKLQILSSEWRREPVLGSTLVAAATMYIPRAWFPDKPLSGNLFFSEQMFPERYAQGAAVEGVSLFGEGYINFGLVGIPLAGLLLGVIVGAPALVATRGPLLLLTYALTVGRIPGLVRGDLAYGLSGMAILLALALPLIALGRAFTRREDTLGSVPYGRRLATNPQSQEGFDELR